MEKQNKPTIYTVATAHLDTVWNWTFETTVNKYVPATLDDNFKLFEKYHDYVFSFEGSRRYELMEEYYPEKFEQLKKYVADGRWFVTGSAYENGDVNVPSPEALFRNILYGNGYFRDKFGKTSVDIYLPDCFGFGYALPSIIKHSGLLGFTTQKLTWSSAYGIPFDLGLWQGVDGSQIYASLDAQDYSATLKSVRQHKNAPNKLKNNLEKYDLPFTYLLHGTGDRGGAPKEASVKTVVSEKKKNAQSDADVEIVSVDYVHRLMDSDLSAEQKKKLPVWNNELVSTDHGVGGYTSRALGKRWNRKNEQLADAAERLSVAAAWCGAGAYPQKELETAWKRVIAHQFHDDLPGTSLECVYKRSWNDYALSLNQFGSLYEAAAENLVRQINVPFARGYAVAVTNPTQFSRTETVECVVDALKAASFVHVKNAKGKAVPSQISGGKILFSATVPANGVAVYCISAAEKPYAGESALTVTERTLENEVYKVTLDDNGDIASVFDKTLAKELLKSPVRMALHKYNGSHPWPAWELDYPEVMAAPVEYAAAPQFKITQNGSARVCIETRRTAGASVFVQRVSLGAGEQTVRVENEIEWYSPRRLLKTPFTFTVQNDTASYDLGLGVIRRGVNTEKLYEVPAQNWADISDENYGVSILSDCKYGWDHPTADTVRLTGVHTPRGDFLPHSHQSYMDMGRNTYAFGIFSHAGADLSATQKAGICFNQPMRVFSAPLKQTGVLESEFSFAAVSDEAVLLRAVKCAEGDTNTVIVRVNEGTGEKRKNVHLRVGTGVRKAWVCNGFEEKQKKAKIENGEVVFDIAAFAPMTFALELEPPKAAAVPSESTPIHLSYTEKTASANYLRRDGILGGCTVPEEQFPQTVRCKNTVFMLSAQPQNALRCCGQSLRLPKDAKIVTLLVTAVGGDCRVQFRVGETVETVLVPDCFEAVGAGDLVRTKSSGYMKDCTLAYEFTHMHNASGDVTAKQCYLFAVELPATGEMLTLPVAEDVLVFAVSVSSQTPCGKALQPLYDNYGKTAIPYTRPRYENAVSRNYHLLSALENVKPLKPFLEKL